MHFPGLVARVLLQFLDQLARLICPIGIPGIDGKRPALVALSIAARVAIWQQELDILQNSRDQVTVPVTA